MSAIAGYSGPLDSDRLESMARALSHHGNHRLSEQKSWGSGFCLNGANQENQHFVASDGDNLLLWSGRLYNHTNFCAQQLLERYLKLGPPFVEDLDGAFVIVIVSSRGLYLFRDPSGHCSIFCGYLNGYWYFASEAKALHRLTGFDRRIKPASFAQFFTFSFVPLANTMLENLYKVPAGSWIEVKPDDSQPVIRRYYQGDRRQIESEHYDESYWINEFEKLLTRCVQERICTNSHAVFLSGGIDSSLIAAKLRELLPGKVSTYSIYFGEKYPNELEYAREVANFCQSEHHEILIEPKQFLPNFRRAIWHLDEPVGDPVTLPNFELARIVSRDHSFVFNGEGGDPIFGGPKNIPMLLHHWYGTEQVANFRELKYLASYRRAFEELKHLFSPEWRSLFNFESDLVALLTPYFKDEQSPYFLDKLRCINLQLKGASLILPKIERLLGAWGLTPLSPLFDQKLIDFSYRMPPGLILKDGVEKVILKLISKKRLPPSIIERPKSGMRVPVHFWFQEELKRYASSVLSPRNIRREGIFNETRVKKLLKYDTEEKSGRYGMKLWMLLSIETWRRLVIEHEAL